MLHRPVRENGAVAPLVSVLLPTRNRLEYLRYAAQTVLRQDDGDLELVISNNDSSEDIEGFVRELGDDRVVYRRTASFVPVTENWQNALDHSTGDYVVMLGDDDGLMPGYVRHIRDIVQRFDRPELIYQAAWLYAYPDVFPDEPAGFLKPYGYAPFFGERTAPFELGLDLRRKVVADAMNFRLTYGFNMQFSTVSRTLVERLRVHGAFYQSKFPDYYATNVAFLTADRVVVDPEALVAVGVTPKSYGFFHENADETGGRSFLEGANGDGERRPGVEAMPGTYINTGWLSAVKAIASNLGDLVPAAPSVRRFRFLQAVFAYEGRYLRGDVTEEQLAEMEAFLSPRERRLGRAVMAGSVAARRVLPPRLSRGAWAFIHHYGIAQFVGWEAPKIEGRYRTLLEVFENPPSSPSAGRAAFRERATRRLRRVG